MNNFFKFHHLGLAVRDNATAIKFLEMQKYSIGPIVNDPLQKVNLIFCSHPTEPAVELVFKSNEDGPITKILSTRNELIYHICYETESLTQSLKILDTVGRAIPVSKPTPAILFDNRLVSFYFLKGVGLIEFLEL